MATTVYNLLSPVESATFSQPASLLVSFRKGPVAYAVLRVYGTEENLLGSLDASAYPDDIWNTETIELTWVTLTERIAHIEAELTTGLDPFYIQVCPGRERSLPAQEEIYDNFVAETCTYLGDHHPLLGNPWESTGSPLGEGITAPCPDFPGPDADRPRISYTTGNDFGYVSPAPGDTTGSPLGNAYFYARQLFAQDAHVKAGFLFTEGLSDDCDDAKAFVSVRAPRDIEDPYTASWDHGVGIRIELTLTGVVFEILDGAVQLATETYSTSSWPLSVEVDFTLSGSFIYPTVTVTEGAGTPTVYTYGPYTSVATSGDEYASFGIIGAGEVPVSVYETYFGPPTCMGLVFDHADGVTDEITWSPTNGTWDASSKATITILVPVQQPYLITIQGTDTAGESLADIYATNYPGSWVKAYDTNDVLIATAESTVYNLVEILPEYVSEAGLGYLELYTAADVGDRVGFGFQYVETHCATPVWVSLPSPLQQEDIQILVGSSDGVRVELPAPPIGAIAALARMLLTTLDVSLPSPIGEILLTARLIPATQVSLPSPIGAINLLLKVEGDAWTGLWPDSCGFSAPRPRLSGYTYSRDAGLQRTKMLSGATRQRRRWTDGRRKAQISVEVPTGALYVFEEFLANFGYSWFLMPLVTGDNGGPTAELHSVRVIADPTFGEVVGETVVATLEIEIQDRG